jgi:hypothetical protein
MSGLGQVEMSGSRYVTGHVGPRPDHEQTRVRARSFAAQGARRDSLNAKLRRYSSSACDKSSGSVNAIARRVPRRWRRANEDAQVTTNCRCRSERACFRS